MAFSIDREWAARRLWVSTRTIDRHIQAERIRTRRIGKKMFLEEEDVETLRHADPARREEVYEVVDSVRIDPVGIETHEIVSRESQSPVHVEALREMMRLYEDAKMVITKKDEVIQDLSYRLGKSETELRNSISLIEYKKATFMLESEKSKNNTDTQNLTESIKRMEHDIRNRNSAIIVLALLFVLVLGFSVLYFLLNLPR